MLKLKVKAVISS